MRSRPERGRARRCGRAAAIVLRVVLAAPLSLAAHAAVAPPADRPAATGARPAPATADRVEAAASALRASGDFGGTRLRRTWQLRSDDDAAPPPSRPMPWLVEFIGWLSEQMRVIVWLVGAAALAALLVAARRWLLVRDASATARARALPVRVRDLDIRPESLPDDVGGAARALWLAGERRAALSLLYRGALSRLVHVHAIPIEDSSTEDDCVRLARAGLAQAPAAFVAGLVRAWQLAVYGARPVETPTVLALCDAFDRELPAQAAGAP